MTQVRVRRTANQKEQVFYFSTHEEAVAFVSGLRVRDSWPKGDELFDAIVEPAVSP